MYRLWHKLFGWDYILWKNSADVGIARVIKPKSGQIAYWRYRITNVLDIIEKPDQVIWLTCSPSKYFNSET